jgi:RNA polymerase sigma factor (sigma-70 family)
VSLANSSSFGGKALPRNGDRDAALTFLFRESYPRLVRVAHAIVGSREVGEELVMDVFVKFAARWTAVRDLDAAPTYLRTSLINACRSRLRRHAVERRLRMPAIEAVVDHGDRVVDAYIVWAALQQLAPRQRIAVTLKYFEDLSEREIAEAMGCSTGTVKSQLAKARVTLAKSLATRGEGMV